MKSIPDLVHASSCSSRNMFFLLLPAMTEQLFVRLVGMVDIVMISSAGEAAMSATTLVNSLNNIFIHLFSALATGGAIASGQHIGANRLEQARQITVQNITLEIFLSLGLTVCLFLFREEVLNLTLGSAPTEVLMLGQIGRAHV